MMLHGAVSWKPVGVDTHTDIMALLMSWFMISNVGEDDSH